MGFENRDNDNWYSNKSDTDRQSGVPGDSSNQDHRETGNPRQISCSPRPAASYSDTTTNSNPSDTAGSYETQYSSPYWTQAEAAVERRSSTKLVIVCISAILFLLLAGIFYALFFRIDRLENTDVHSGTEPYMDGGFDGGYGDEFADDFNSFFEEYYTEDVTGQNTIPQVAGDPNLTLTLSTSTGDPLSLQEIYQKCASAVVGIIGTVSDTESYWGTGIIFASDGYIVTNYHILDGAESATVCLSDGTEYPAQMVGYDSQSDLAVLKIDASGLPVAEFGDSNALSVGDPVVAIGNPLGEDLQGTMTDGIISAINRDVQYDNNSMTLIQTNAAINNGNSGGPLINQFGQVIGITNMKMISYYSNIEGIGFAIPSTTVKSVVDQLISQGYISGRTMIGITAGPIPDSAANYYDIPTGLYVSKVTENSGADVAGIQPGDIVTEANGQAVSTVSELNQIRNTLSIGDFITLTIYRDGNTFQVDVELMDEATLR
jgi:serine protease Do